MDRSIVPTLVELFGFQKAAEQLLNKQPEELDPEVEQLFLDRWSHIEPATLFTWFTRKAPENTGPRPYGEVVPRVTEWLVGKAATDPFAALTVPQWIAGVADELVRDDLVERLRGRVPDSTWTRLVPHAAGCKVFTLLASFDIRTQQHRHGFPHGLVAERPIPELGDRLFDARRDELKLTEVLREMVADPAIGSYTLWALRELDLLKTIVTPEMLLDGLSTIQEVGLEGRTQIRFNLELAEDLSDEPSFKEAVTRRILEASARGVPWGYLWWEIPEELRDDIGLASIDTEKPAPWALAAVERRLDGLDAWMKRLAFAEWPEPDLGEHVHFHRGASLWAGQPFPKTVEGEDEFFPRLDTAWLISGPLPEHADAAFERRLERVLRGYYHYDERIVWNRLAELPLTTERAKRIVEGTLSGGIFYDLERCKEIAEACGPVQEAVPRPKRWDATVLRAYAVLVDDQNCVAKWFDESVAAKDFNTALQLALHDDRTPKADRAEALRKILPREDIRTLLRLHEEHPWLVSESDMMTEAASGQFPDHQWSWLGKTVPPNFVPVVEAKAGSTSNVELAGELFQLLTKSGIPTRRIAEIALERVRSLGPDAMSPHKFGRLLGSGKLWENPGEELVAHVLQERGPEGAKWLVDVVHESCRSNDKIVHVVHAVIANVLISLAKKGMEDGNLDGARRALTALVDLTAPPRLFRKVRALRELPGANTLSLLLDANEGLMRRSDDEQPNVDSLLNALAAFFSSDSGGEL